MSFAFEGHQVFWLTMILSVARLMYIDSQKPAEKYILLIVHKAYDAVGL